MPELASSALSFVSLRADASALFITQDYCQNFVDTGERPQNFIRNVELENRFEEFPAKRELMERKARRLSECTLRSMTPSLTLARPQEAIIRARATAPAYLRCDLRTFPLSVASLGSKFDVILIDPPWDEYARRAAALGGAGGDAEPWSWEEIRALRIEDIADTPSFVFLWCGSAEGLTHGRACLAKWGFRRTEDICWLKTNKRERGRAWADADAILVPCKEHCLMGMRGSVRRSSDGHIIHANVDTDVIVSEEPPFGDTAKPEELYHIIEHFAQGRRRLELFGEDHNIRPGWVTLGKSLSSSSFDPAAYAEQVGVAAAADWQAQGGNPMPGAPWLLGSTPEIEELRPKSPVRGGGHGGNSGPSAWAGRGGGRGAPFMLPGGPGRGPGGPPQQGRAPPDDDADRPVDGGEGILLA